MSVDVLILNSGEWVLGEELAAAPWHVLIYRQRGESRNELHLWLPREAARPLPGDFAFKRFWVSRSVRWCVEMPADPERARSGRGEVARLRFSSPDGQVLWAEHRGGRGLGDFSDRDLSELLASAHAGRFSLP